MSYRIPNDSITSTRPGLSTQTYAPVGAGTSAGGRPEPIASPALMPALPPTHKPSDFKPGANPVTGAMLPMLADPDLENEAPPVRLGTSLDAAWNLVR